MDKKKIATFVAIVGVVGAGAFYGGVRYGMSKNALKSTGPGQGQMGMRDGQDTKNSKGTAPQGAPQGKQGGGMSAGEITSKDDKSITIKTQDGSSRIIYFSDSATVGKEVSASLSDLATGQQVLINGKTNTDGSVAAQNIQIRSAQEQVPLQ